MTYPSADRYRDPQPPAMPTGQISRQLDAADSVTEDILRSLEEVVEETVGRLEQRLEQYAHPVPTTPTPAVAMSPEQREQELKKAEAERQEMVPAAARLSRTVERLRQARTRLGDLNGRLMSLTDRIEQ